MHIFFILHLNVFYIEIFIVVKKIFLVYVYLILLQNWYWYMMSLLDCFSFLNNI